MIEVTTFRLHEGADEEAFRLADSRLQTGFAYQQAGLARRTTAKARDGSWIVIDLWESETAAHEAAVRWGSDAVVAGFLAFLDPASILNSRYYTL